MTPRDDKILAHIGLYRMSLRRTLERLFFHGSAVACDNVLRRLIESGRVQRVRGLPRRISYYQLTRAEAARLGFPTNRAGRLRPQALQQHLAVLWFCCMGPTQRMRLEAGELHTIDPSFPIWPQVAHCLEGGPVSRVYRVFVLGPRTRHFDVVARLRKRLIAESEHPVMGAMGRTGHRGVAILVEQPSRRSAIERAVEHHRLRTLAPVVVDFAPGLSTISRALHDHA